MKEILVLDIATFNKSIHLRELSENEFRELIHNDSNSQSAKAMLNTSKEYEQKAQRLIERYKSPARSFGLYDNKNYIGYISFGEYECSSPEIQIEIQENYQNCGIGYNALSFLIAEVFRQREDIKYFIYYVRADNIASVKLVEKLGGKCVKQGDFIEYLILKYHIMRDKFNFAFKID